MHGRIHKITLEIDSLRKNNLANKFRWFHIRYIQLVVSIVVEQICASQIGFHFSSKCCATKINQKKSSWKHLITTSAIKKAKLKYFTYLNFPEIFGVPFPFQTIATFWGPHRSWCGRGPRNGSCHPLLCRKMSHPCALVEVNQSGREGVWHVKRGKS